MIAYLFKPFGADNYLVLTKPDEITEFFEKVVPGDEFVLRVQEFSDDDFNGLESFDGFAGPTEGSSKPTEEVEETPPEEPIEPDDEELNKPQE